MANNVKSEIKNTGFADIPCDETIHRDDNHMWNGKTLCKLYASNKRSWN